MPSPAAVVEATTAPSFTASIRIPAYPSSDGSGAPSRPTPLPRVKSCQVVPVIFPGSGLAATAFLAPSGIWSGATPTRGRATGCPGRTVALVTKPPSCATSGDSRPGCALGNADDCAKVSCTPTHTAFATPLCGSWSYTSRKMIPAASIEIAIGMKTTSLNAVPQRTRSVSTAKTRPSAVETVGANTTQTTLFFRAVRMPSSVKSVR